MKFYDFLHENALEEGIQKIVVGGIIINEDGKILVLEREKSDFMGGIHELPSGTMEANENIKETLLREVKEETNLDIKNIVGYINSFDYLSGSGKKTRQFNFIVEAQEYNSVETSEHDGYYWMSIDECRDNKNITSEVKKTIEVYDFNYKVKKLV